MTVRSALGSPCLVPVVTEAEAFPSGRDAVGMSTVSIGRPVIAHSHDFAELVFTRRGAALQHMEQGTAEVTAGTVTLLSPGSWHAFEPEPQIVVTNVYFSRSLFHSERQWFSSIPRLAGILRERPAPMTRQTVTVHVNDAAWADVEATLDRFVTDAPRSVFGRMARLYDVIDALAPVLRDPSQPTPCEPVDIGADDAVGVSPYRPSVARAISLLHDRLDHSWRLEELAELVLLSPSQLSRVFRADTGGSVMTYMRRARAEQMGFLLQSTAVTVAAAGRAVGWHDPGHAARRFHHHWGMSPTEFRNRLYS